jgi:DNA segregation ATPase FtsK/SpoIIIE, S-DNA-T family
MPKVDVNKKRGYEASIPVEKIWSKLESGEISEDLLIPLGEDKNKKDNFLSLSRYFHVLAIGQALSGIGMFRRVALATLLKFNKPEDLKVILIDPLKISFFHFKNIEKYLLFPIITENEKAMEALEWARQENERRFQLLMKDKFRNVDSYNKKNPEKKLPKIVIIISEFGELMDYDSKKFEGQYLRVSTMAKALGIYSILTTQRPNNDVVSPLIKSNVWVKIAFQLPGIEESRIAIDQSGAEKLLGQGDMLVKKCDEEPERFQGYCLEEEDVEKIDFK